MAESIVENPGPSTSFEIRVPFAGAGKCSERGRKLTAEILTAEEAFRKRMQTIAHAEMARRRSHLGVMTLEQERALEQLLTSTVERISDPIVERVRECYATGEIEKALALCSIFS